MRVFLYLALFALPFWGAAVIITAIDTGNPWWLVYMIYLVCAWGLIESQLDKRPNDPVGFKHGQ